MTLKDGDVIKCPDCSENWEGVVQDYVLVGVSGIDSETTEQCGYCDAYLRIVRDPDGSYFVEVDDDANEAVS